MANQALLIGIAVGVFFAGLGIGYAAFSQNQSTNFMQMSPQQMQQIMNNPQMMTQWHQTMMSNPQAMNNWMNTMMQDPNTMNQWMGTMMSNPQMSQYMMNSMMQNNQFMQNMMGNQQFQQNWMGPWMMNNPNWQGMMNQGMMGSGMMGGMMGQPITKNTDVLLTISNIEKLLDQMSSEYRDGNQETAFSLATTAYLENYEYIEGTISQKDPALMQKIEIMMRVDLRSMIQNGESPEDIDAKIDSIKENLDKVKSLFQ